MESKRESHVETMSFGFPPRGIFGYDTTKATTFDLWQDGDYFNDVYKYEIATSMWGSVDLLDVALKIPAVSHTAKNRPAHDCLCGSGSMTIAFFLKIVVFHAISPRFSQHLA